MRRWLSRVQAIFASLRSLNPSQFGSTVSSTACAIVQRGSTRLNGSYRAEKSTTVPFKEGPNVSEAFLPSLYRSAVEGPLTRCESEGMEFGILAHPC
jgi:hypothetical protein